MSFLSFIYYERECLLFVKAKNETHKDFSLRIGIIQQTATLRNISAKTIFFS